MHITVNISISSAAVLTGFSLSSARGYLPEITINFFKNFNHPLQILVNYFTTNMSTENIQLIFPQFHSMEYIAIFLYEI